MQMLKKLFMPLVSISIMAACFSTESFAQSHFDSLTNKLQQVVLKDSLPGLSVVLVNDKGIIYNKSFGFADIEKQTAFTSGSIQNIGSVSKTLIAVALMKAIEMGDFTLDTDINTILPFKVVNPNDPDGKITIRQLVNHTSSIIDNPSFFPDTYLFYPALAGYNENAFNVLRSLGYQGKVPKMSLKDFYFNYLSTEGKYYSAGNFAKGKAGSTSSYSNIGSALAAYLIEIKSGMPYDEFTTRYILKPLKMAKSGWHLSSAQLPGYAKPYYNLKANFPFYECITYPDGGLRASAADLSRYLMEIIKGYKGQGKILKSQSYQTMFVPQFAAENLPKNFSLKSRNKGIFWNLYNNGTIGHDGDDPGVSTYLFFNTNTGLGGIFLCNKYLADKSNIVNLLLAATDH